MPLLVLFAPVGVATNSCTGAVHVVGDNTNEGEMTPTKAQSSNNSIYKKGAMISLLFCNASFPSVGVVCLCWCCFPLLVLFASVGVVTNSCTGAVHIVGDNTNEGGGQINALPAS